MSGLERDNAGGVARKLQKRQRAPLEYHLHASTGSFQARQTTKKRPPSENLHQTGRENAQFSSNGISNFHAIICFVRFRQQMAASSGKRLFHSVAKIRGSAHSVPVDNALFFKFWQDGRMRRKQMN